MIFVDFFVSGAVYFSEPITRIYRAAASQPRGGVAGFLVSLVTEILLSQNTFPSSVRRIYTSGPCSYWASSCPADLPTLECLMRFLFVGPTVCRGLPSDSASRRTPLPLAMRLALPPALGTFTLENVPMPSTHRVGGAGMSLRRPPTPPTVRFRSGRLPMVR